jgi:hypothetical protein
MLPLGLFRNKEFAGAQVAVFSISASFFAIFLYTTLYLQKILDLSPIEAGLVYLPCTVLIFFVSAASASVLEKVSAGALIAFGLGFVAIGLSLGLLATATSSWWMLVPSLMIGGLGTGLFNPAGAAVALGSVPAEQSGLASGVNDTFRQAGIAVGVALFGALIPASAARGRIGRVVRLRDAHRVHRRRSAGRDRRGRVGAAHRRPARRGDGGPAARRLRPRAGGVSQARGAEGVPVFRPGVAGLAGDASSPGVVAKRDGAPAIT